MKLYLGAGEDHQDGYVHVDLRPEVADVVCDARKLEHWADESVEEILALDLLEHFPASETQAILLEWRRVLVPEGKLTVKVPNLTMLARWIADGYHVQAAITNIYGGHRWGPDGSWDAHHTGWTPELLRAELQKAGFTVIKEDRATNMTFEAIKR